MNKIKKHFDVNHQYLYWDGRSITQIKQDLEELEKLGATHINIQYWHDDGIEISATSERFETDEEYNKRIQQLELKNQTVKEKELQELQRLINKYGKE